MLKFYSCPLEGLLGGDVFASLVGLGLHDALHVSRPAVLTGHQGAGGVGQSLGQHGLLDLQQARVVSLPIQHGLITNVVVA